MSEVYYFAIKLQEGTEWFLVKCSWLDGWYTGTDNGNRNGKIDGLFSLTFFLFLALKVRFGSVVGMT